MDTLKMLHQMCHDELSQADVNAIRKSRGFSEQETATRALLENFYLSETGVEAAMATLTNDEVVFLHLLALIGDEVPIPAFARLYPDLDRPEHGTYTQCYKPLFDHIRETLIRKGLLIFAEDPQSGADTQNERRRYRFPQAFERFLPPPIRDVRRFETPGDGQPDILRQKLCEIMPDAPAIKVPKFIESAYALALVEGDLHIGGKIFELEHLLAWQRVCWDTAAPEPKSKRDYRWYTHDERKPSISPVEATIYLLSHLAPDAWVRPEQLANPLRIFHGQEIDSAAVCQAGHQWGRLARREVNGAPYYRLTPLEAEAAVEPEDYLSVESDGLALNLGRIPYDALTYLNRIADLHIADGKDMHLTATPSVIKTGRWMALVRNHTLTPWLRANAPAFRTTLETVEARWGHHIIHENVLVAEIDDLGLQAQLTHAFQDDHNVVFLTDTVMAFPQNKLREVQRMIDKAGHVIKVVAHDA